MTVPSGAIQSNLCTATVELKKSLRTRESPQLVNENISRSEHRAVLNETRCVLSRRTVTRSA